MTEEMPLGLTRLDDYLAVMPIICGTCGTRLASIVYQYDGDYWREIAYAPVKTSLAGTWRCPTCFPEDWPTLEEELKAFTKALKAVESAGGNF